MKRTIIYQSVSNTTALCPLNSGSCSGNRPFSPNGITANAPPPLASQLTARYCGFALQLLDVESGPLQQDVYLDQVGVPSILRNPEVVVALLLHQSQNVRTEEKSCATVRTFRVGLPKTCPTGCLFSVDQTRILSSRTLRYFDERTNRPDMISCA